MTEVINAAGKLTALGGTAQSAAVAAAQQVAARKHVDLAECRQEVGRQVAALCGAEAGCITSGAAAGICIAIAGLVTAGNVDASARLPATDREYPVLLQAGHNINFGAPVEQMIRLGGGTPRLVGHTNLVTTRMLADTLAHVAPVALLYVQSHHCVQTNQVSLADCVRMCRDSGVPVVVDAAAEADLREYVACGADLVIYSGGKAYGGPTSGFVVGRAPLVEACEAQFAGIARPMKIGKEGLAGLAAALQEYTATGDAQRLAVYAATNAALMRGLAQLAPLSVRVQADEAGRDFSRIAVSLADPTTDIRDLVRHLAAGNPSIRTRNHHLDEGYLLIDPRELTEQHVEAIIARFGSYAQLL